MIGFEQGLAGAFSAQQHAWICRGYACPRFDAPPRDPEYETDGREFLGFTPCLNRKAPYMLALVRKRRRARRGAPGDKANGRGEKLVLNKTAVVCVFCDMGRGGKGRRPDASCERGQALEKAQNGNGRLLEKVGMDLGSAPRPLGFGATSAWVGCRLPLGARAAPVWIDATMPTVAIRAIGLCLCRCASANTTMYNMESVHANSRGGPNSQRYNRSSLCSRSA